MSAAHLLRQPRSRILAPLLGGLVAIALAVHPASAQDTAPPAPAAQADNTRTLAALIGGLSHSMRISAEALATPGQRLAATRALDDARRMARVLRDVVPGKDAAGQAGLDAVERARHALQNGNPLAARGILDAASRQLAQQAAHPPAMSGGALDAADAGKLVINAEGEPLGRLQRLVTDRQGAARAVLKVGGTINLFGFVDAGYHRVSVPAGQLLAGRTRVALGASLDAEQAAQQLPAWSD